MVPGQRAEDERFGQEPYRLEIEDDCPAFPIDTEVAIVHVGLRVQDAIVRHAEGSHQLLALFREQLVRLTENDDIWSVSDRQVGITE